MEKVLLVLYYWPPAGGPGVQRWLKFVTYLKDHQLEPHIYIPSNPHYPIRDESLLVEVPEQLTIIRQPINEPYKWASLLSKEKTKQMSSGMVGGRNRGVMANLLLAIRGNMFVPDSRKNWINPSVQFLSQYLEEHQIKKIITTGPPHSLHLIGMQLKKKLGIKWVADFRDPWTNIHYHKKLLLFPWVRRKHIRLESEVLQFADSLIVTSPSTAKEFGTKTNTPIHLITNGYDNEILDSVDLDTQFSLTHIGSLLSERNPEVLWKVLAEISNEEPSFLKDLRIRFVGVVDPKILNSITLYGLDAQIENLGYCTHQEALNQQASSQILLLIESSREAVRGIIPGKFFEYATSNRPILAIGPKNWDISEYIQNTNTGVCFSYNQEKAIKEYIVSCYEQFKMRSLGVKPQHIEKYHRKNLTADLAELLWAL